MSDSTFLKTTVILPVSDLYKCISWYQSVLGFQTSYIHGNGRPGEDPNFANYAILFRDGVEVHLILDESKDRSGRGWDSPGNGRLGLTVSNVDALYDTVRTTGVAIENELKQLNWPARGFDLRDIDNNLIHIEQQATRAEG